MMKSELERWEHLFTKASGLDKSFLSLEKQTSKMAAGRGGININL